MVGGGAGSTPERLLGTNGEEALPASVCSSEPLTTQGHDESFLAMHQNRLKEKTHLDLQED